ncbi:MAG TPA: malate dehydrogenase [Gammaproteobacteria bacterium]|nr:malate dehydrogenase [Gammaproteobacteria bacterium]
MKKITIIGAGRVGESTAQILANEEHAHEIVLLDIREGVARGTALDIQESATLFGFDSRVTGDEDNSAMEGSDIVIITAGLPRKPGMSRSDVLDANLEIIRGLTADIMRYAPDAKVIMVTNPVDVLTYSVWKQTGWDRSRVFGLSGVLDAARMASFIALETGFSIKDITTLVLGGHGDSMVPMSRFTTINGIPLDTFLSQEKIQQIVDRTRNGGAEILALKKTSSANDSPAAAVATMVDAVCNNRKRILPCVAILDGEYEHNDLAIGVPVILGNHGMEQVIELQLSETEHRQFQESAEQVKKDLAGVS